MNPRSFAVMVLAFVMACGSARADRIVMKDGRVLEGRLEKEEPGRVLLRMKLGSVWIRLSDIASVEREPDPVEEYEKRSKAVTDSDAAAWIELGRFCLSKNLYPQAEECFSKALAADPGSAEARAALDRILTGRAIERVASAATVADALEAWPQIEPLGDAGSKAFGDALSERVARLDRICSDAPGLEAWASAELRSLRLKIRSIVMNERLYTDGAAATRARVLEMVALLGRMYDGPHDDGFICSHPAAAKAATEAKNMAAIQALFEGSDASVRDALEAAFCKARAAFAQAAKAACAANSDTADQKIGISNAKAALESGLSPDEEAGLAAVNSYRVRLGLGALRLDSSLYAAARDHSRAMSRNGFFSHESPLPGFKTPYARIRKAGYDWRIAGENIAKCEGGLTPQRALEAWIDSPGHHRNLIRPEFEDAGLGVDGEFWTLDLASRRKD